MADHVEVLRVLRDFYAGSVLDHKEKADALTAAILDIQALRLLIAAGHVSQQKVNEALRIAELAASAPVQGASHD